MEGGAFRLKQFSEILAKTGRCRAEEEVGEPE